MRHHSLVKTYPVKNKFPMLALEKLKVLLGRALFTASRLTELRKDRINSRFGGEMLRHRSEVPSTMSSHSSRASRESLGSRWLKSILMAIRSGSSPLSDMRRTRRPKMGIRCELYCIQVSCILRKSPMPAQVSTASSLTADVLCEPGPPKTLISSLELPPLSLIGIT
jgi:hypothetical protein